MFWNKDFDQSCFEIRTAKGSEPICWSFLSYTSNMMTYICCVPLFLHSPWLVVLSTYQKQNESPFGSFVKFSSRDTLLHHQNCLGDPCEGEHKKICINDLNINFTWVCHSSFCFKVCQKCRYFHNWAISTFLCNDMYIMLPNKSCIKHAGKTFLPSEVFFCFPISVANEIFFLPFDRFSKLSRVLWGFFKKFLFMFPIFKYIQ